MKTKLNGTLLNKHLATVCRLTMPDSGIVNLHGTKHLCISSSNQTSTTTITLPFRIDEQLDIGLPVDALKSAIRGYEELDAEYSNAMFKLKSGRYKIELSAVDSVSIDPFEFSGDGIELDSDQLNELRNLLKLSYLKSTTASGNIPVAVKMTSKGTSVVCFELSRITLAKSKELTGDCTFVLPVDTLNNAINAVSDKCTLYLSDSNLFIKSGKLKSQLALPVLDSGLPSADEVFKLAKKASSSKGNQLTLDTDKIKNFIENCHAIRSTANMELTASAGDKGTKLQVKTELGSVSISLKSKLKSGFKIDVDAFAELLGRADDKSTLSIIDDTFLKLESNKFLMCSALNQ